MKFLAFYNFYEILMNIIKLSEKIIDIIILYLIINIIKTLKVASSEEKLISSEEKLI